jgi:hypothetical protein
MTNTYGTAAGVANYARVYTANGSFTASTNPTSTAVGVWLDQVSAMVNASLAGYGFVIPITQADVKLTITATVEQLVAELCQAANSAGRFFTEKALASGVSPWKAVRDDVKSWVNANAAGFEQLGAARSSENEELTIGFRSSDDNNDATFPIFQRKAFGNRFEDWTNSGGDNPGT